MEEQVQEVQEPKEEPKEEKPVEKIKLKIDGEEVEMTKDEVIREAQKAKAVEKRFREADAKEKALLEKLGDFESIKKDPVRGLSKLGIDFYKLAEDKLTEKLYYDSLPDDQKKAKEADKKLRELDEREKTISERELSIQADKDSEAWLNHHDNVINKALKNSEIPDTKGIRQRITSYYIAAEEELNAKQDYETDVYEYLPVDKVLELVKGDIADDMKAFIGKMSMEEAEKVLGKDAVKKIVRYLVEVPKPINNPAKR